MLAGIVLILITFWCIQVEHKTWKIPENKFSLEEYFPIHFHPFCYLEGMKGYGNEVQVQKMIYTKHSHTHLHIFLH